MINLDLFQFSLGLDNYCLVALDVSICQGHRLVRFVQDCRSIFRQQRGWPLGKQIV